MNNSCDILVYGFDGFADWSINPSEMIVQQLAQHSGLPESWQLHTRVLPTDYTRADELLSEALHQVRPQIVLGLGLTSLRETLCAEQIAINIDSAITPDNANAVRQDQAIDPGGPLALPATADVASVVAAIGQDDVPIEISYHAGTYVCNHTYYRALRAIAQLKLDALCLFVHLPMIQEGELSGQPYERHWQLHELRRAVDRTLADLVHQAANSSRNT